MIRYINARCEKIVNVLLSQSEYLSINQLAAAMNISRRTLYYDIDKINQWLTDAGLQELEIVPKKGIFISESCRGEILSLLEEEDEEQMYLFSPAERTKAIICYIIYSPEHIYLEQLTECFKVSRNTIFSDLKMVSASLEQYELTLEYQPKTGYYIAGDPVRTRALFGMYFNEMNALFTGGLMKFFHMNRVQDYRDRLDKIQKEIRVEYVDGVLMTLAALIPISYQQKETIIISGLKQNEIMKSREFIMIEKYFPDLPLDEQIYLSLQLLGARVNLVPDEYFESESKTYVYDLTKSLICEFEKVACIIFNNRAELERALFIHLNTSLYRYRYGLQIGNLLGNDIMNEYPELFSITRITAKRLEDDFGVPIPDSEIAYLAMHFGSFLQIPDRNNDRLRILIVCVNGISTGNMLKREVQKLLPFAEIVDVVAAINLNNAQDICDLIISTVRLNSVIPVITVHPILTEFDRRNILGHRLIAPKNVAVQRDNLFRLVKKYVDPEKFDQLLQDLTSYLEGGAQAAPEEDVEEGILGILNAPRIRFVEGLYSWKQSIRIAGEYLLKCQSIKKNYLDTIIEQLQLYGPYMFLTDDVILAHAKPEDGVNCLDFSFTIFRDPVKFSEYKKARIIIVLAAVDQEKHLKILQDILTVIDQPDSVDQLCSCGTSAELIQTMTRLLENKE